MHDLRFSLWALVVLLSSSLVSLVAPVAVAQQGVPNKFTVKRIIFKGTTPYSQAALEASSGVKPGDTITTDGLSEAVQRLVDTGAFAEVGATVDGPIKSVDLIFTVKPAEPDHMVRASFDNFIWFTHEELAVGIQERVPLFNGTLPDGGNLQEKVEKALEEMLVARSVTAMISYQIVEPKPGRPYRMVEYVVTKPQLRMHKLDVSGVPATFVPAHEKVVSAMIGHAYYDGLYNGISDSILDTFRNAGYLDASLSGLKSSIVSSANDQLDVDVSATLTAGEVYHVTKLEWAGSPLMSASDFSAASKLHAGDVASLRTLQASLKNLNSAYENQGYMDVIVDAAPTLDAATHQVSYEVTAVPGVQYKVRDITVAGLSPAQRADFDAAWKMMPGDVYNVGYVTDFLEKLHGRPGFFQLKWGFKATRQPEDAVCDLLITFTGGQ